MIRKLAYLLVAITLVASGCAHKFAMSVDDARTGSDRMSGIVDYYALPARQSGLVLNRGVPSRFIAVRHKLEILASEASLAKGWQSVIDFCATIQCEVVSSSVMARTSESVPTGSIILRVAPQDYAKLFAETEKQGNIIQHTTETEDKTSQVVDLEAKIKNQNTYRDSLRAMLAKPSAKVSDLVEIQEKLTEVQSELDSEAAQRKILANETEKIAVEINFRIEVASRRRSVFAPIGAAFRDSGYNLSESVATLIAFVIAILPWLVALILVIWIIRKLWRRRVTANRRNFA